jgi:hypothetical protein
VNDRTCPRAAAWIAATAMAAVRLTAAQDEKPVTPESLDSGSSGALSLSAGGFAISGFGAAEYRYDFRTQANSFEGSTLAVSLFRPIGDRVSVFGQLTVARTAPSPFAGSEQNGAETSTEIDNLQVRWSALPESGLDVTAGKFDSPLGLERDDAPLKYVATDSFTFSFGRPVKFTGVQVHEAFSPKLEAYAILSNGWDSDRDENRAKTGALYAVWSPSLTVHAGLGVVEGAEKPGRTGDPRTTAIATVLVQQSDSWVYGEEFVWGHEPRSTPSGSAAEWYADMFFTHYRFGPHWGLTLRTEYFDDRDGSRTGVPQILRSATLSPQYRIGSGSFGVFRTLEHTTLSMPELVVRLDLRGDHSSRPVFAGRRTDELRRDRLSAALQTVFLF